MNLLFFFVHPSKFHVFRKTINYLLYNGHKVEIAITSKDVLEDLVKREKWNYTNIFPKGRKIKGINPFISSGINFFRTIFRLYKFVKGKKFDLFITDDLLVFIGKWMKVPVIVFTDDDLAITKQFSIILSRATYILAPLITDLGKYNSKKIGFDGYKELAYLHPNNFVPDKEIVKAFNPNFEKYFLIRLVSMRAYHDVGMKGLSNEQIKKIISLLETKGKVYISSERKLPDEFEIYRLNISPENILHVIYFAELFIGDSQTMTSEAAVLGVPAFRCNDFKGKISVMNEKEEKYELSFNYSPQDFEKMYDMLEKIINDGNIKDKFLKRRQKMLSEKIDLSNFMIWLLENYPKSILEYQNNPHLQYKFK